MPALLLATAPQAQTGELLVACASRGGQAQLLAERSYAQPLASGILPSITAKGQLDS